MGKSRLELTSFW